MKRTTFIWACLALLVATSGLKANNPDLRKSIEKIPNATLTVEIDVQTKQLDIKTSGLASGTKNWIIYSRELDYESRVTTQNLIHKIKICDLEKGEYVLMIKDQNERILHSPFVIE